MGTITRGALKGCYAPDYDGGSVVNLMASIIRSRGGKSPHVNLGGLPATQLAPFSKVVYLVVDGLGDQQLKRYLESGGGRRFFGVNPYAVISTVFPATTASAVTTFATGATPLEHGIIGWHLNLPDLGLVSTILPAVTRTGMPIADGRFDLFRYLRLPNYVDSSRGCRELISFGHIPDSRFSRAGGRWHHRTAFSSLAEMERKIFAFTRRRGRGLAYVYWPGYDTVCHDKGCRHARAARHLDALDRRLAGLAYGLRETGTALIVTADHGIVDTPPAHRIELRDVPRFYGCLATLPSGDARQAQCFVRPAKVAEFRKVVRCHLEKACICLRGEDVLALGLFGRGRRHPSLRARLGDFVLIARDDCAFASSLPMAPSEFNVGNHGGMSRDEMLVPVYVAGVWREASGRG